MTMSFTIEDPWMDLLDRLALPEETRDQLSGTRLQRVEVSPTGDMWHVVVVAPDHIAEPVRKMAQHSLSQVITKDVAVTLQFIGPQAQVGLDELIRMSVDIIGTDFPFIKAWLERAVWESKDGTMYVGLGSELAMHLLTARGGLDLLRQLWAGHRPEMRIELFLDHDLAAHSEADFTVSDDELGICLPSVADISETPSEAVLVGEPIGDAPRAIASFDEDFGAQAVVEGYVTQWEIRKTKRGKTLLRIDLADETDAITVKCVLNDDSARQKCGQVLGAGQWLRVRGELTFDRYVKEETIWADAISSIRPKRRLDQAEEKRVELHLHTQMSSLDAITRIKDLFEQLAAWGHKAVAITDHGSVQAFPDAYRLGQRHGIKVLYGVEGYLVDDEPDPRGDKTQVYHIVILVKNQRGLHNLYRLITVAHLDCFHRVPRIPRSVLEKYREGLILGSACEAGEVFQSFVKGESRQQAEDRAGFYDYLEIQPWKNNEFLVRNGEKTKEELLEINRRIVEMGTDLGIPVAATGDVHFLHPEDEMLRRILLSGQNYADADFQPPLHLQTTAEMLEEFSYLGPEMAHQVVIQTPNDIADQIEEIKPVPDGLSTPKIEGAAERIEVMARTRAHELYGDPLPAVVAERLNKELDSIISNGFAEIYLIAHQLVEKSLQYGYLVGSRGSVGSSLVATLCQITEVNPLAPHYRCGHCRYFRFQNPDGGSSSGYDLPDDHCPNCGCDLIKEGQDIPFETFLGLEGDKVPDIDLNFSGECQTQIHRYTEDLFGRDNVFRAGTISTLADRTAFGLVKGYADDRGLKFKKAQIDRLVQGLCGIRRTTGQHPGGLIVVPSDRSILEFTPVQYPADAKHSEVRTTHFDYHSINDRLLKLDLLGHDNPTVLKMLEELTGVDPCQVPLDDPETMALFSGVSSLGVDPEAIDSEVGTLGLPEFGTRFVRQMLIETKPRTFSELVRISGLSHGTDVWINNARDLIRSGQAGLSEVICTRDDIMLFLLQRGLDPALSFRIMEDVRKGRGLTPEMEDAMIRQGVPQWYIDSCQKIKYMFPKAHAAAYVLMAVRIAYFKVHFPEAFYATCFTMRTDDFDLQFTIATPDQVQSQIKAIESQGLEVTAKERNMLSLLEIVREMSCRGLKIAPLDIMLSDPYRFQITAQGLLPPLVCLSGLGRSGAESIDLARRERSFSSQEDLGIRGRLSKTLLSALQEAGCLSHLPVTDQLDLFGEAMFS